LLSVNEIKNLAQNVHSSYPIFWIAQYEDGYEKIKVPQCDNCGAFVRVLDYSHISCINGCAASFNWHDFELNNGLIMEYENGIETIEFKFLPIDRMKRFYFYIIPKQQLLGINLENGEYIIDGVEIGAGMALEHVPIAVSSQLNKYEDLFCFKSFLSSVGGAGRFIWYKMGYICELKQMKVAMMLFIHMPTLQPYFFSEIL